MSATSIDVFDKSVIPYTPAATTRFFTERDVLLSILAQLVGTAVGQSAPAVPGFAIPAYDYAAMTYVGSTNNVHTITYKTGGSGGTTVATLTFTYVASGVADDDDIATIAKS